MAGEIISAEIITYNIFFRADVTNAFEQIVSVPEQKLFSVSIWALDDDECMITDGKLYCF